MSADLPEVLDAWRMVAARRGFEGTLPLSAMARLRDALCDDAGVVRYTIGFDRDPLGIPYVEVQAQADLPLTCQRTMERFLQPVQVVQRLALLPADTDLEAAEAGLPPGYEPLPLPADGSLRPADLVEDELILAVPVVPINPDSTLPDAYRAEEAEEGEVEKKPNPFGVLSALKDKQQ